MQGTNQDACRPAVSWCWAMQVAEKPTLEPDSVIILFCDSAFCDRTLLRCGAENSGDGI